MLMLMIPEEVIFDAKLKGRFRCGPAWPLTWLDKEGILRMKPPRTKLPASGAGKNARGVCLHKTTKAAKRAKRQNPPQGGPNVLRAKPLVDPSRMPGRKKR